MLRNIPNIQNKIGLGPSVKYAVGIFPTYELGSGFMEDILEKIKKAKVGEIISLVKTIEEPIDAVEYFGKLSNNGRKKYSLFLESADIVPKYGEMSIGTASPCLKISGSGENFEIKALNPLGLTLLKSIKKDLSFTDKLIHKKDTLYGTLAPKRKKLVSLI